MRSARTAVLIVLAMVAFAANSLLCRAALKHTVIDAATFTALRLASGAFMLWLIVRLRGGRQTGGGNWVSAFMLFAYAAGFSFAYVTLPAASGALLLFGAVQATMIGYGLWTGERLMRMQVVGLLVAIGGVVVLMLPGLSAPPLFGAALMLGAGVAWGVYSLLGRRGGDPTGATAGNFSRALPFATVLTLLTLHHNSLDYAGFWYAVSSGAVASGVGYALWYAALPALKSTHAATVQLSVPVLAAVGAVIFLGEAMTPRLAVASAAILGGIALVVLQKQKNARSSRNEEAESSSGDAQVLPAQDQAVTP